MYAVVRDTPLSWQDYRLLMAELDADLPDGLLIWLAGRHRRRRAGDRDLARPRRARSYEREQLQPSRDRVPALLAPETVRTLDVEHVVQRNKQEEEP
jgi:hypothetical protein